MTPGLGACLCVPGSVQYTASAAEIKSVVSSVNGVLFTGGGADFTNPDGTLTQFAAAAQLIVDQVTATNKAGMKMPLWGE
jgi:hypothetical protein